MAKQDKPTKLIVLLIIGTIFVFWQMIGEIQPTSRIDTKFKFFLVAPVIGKYSDIYMLDRPVYSFQVKDYESDSPNDTRNPPYVECGIYSYKLTNEVRSYNQQELVSELNNRLGNKYNFPTYQDESGSQKWMEIKYSGIIYPEKREFRTLWFPIRYLNNFLAYRNQIDGNTKFIPQIDNGSQSIPSNLWNMQGCISTMRRQEDSLLRAYTGSRFGEEYHRFLSDRKLQQERDRILKILSEPDTVVRVDTSDGLIYFYNLREDRMVVIDP
ncbi:hypothetical protein H9Q10_09245 [Eikenella sp. S3360]|uniref:Uncharacterized protein n=1 Tax=Eikenella glucosivorans TaxID=2766967 RepID=A0ABS0NC09_9NEIS|nr:hypothetical protein [Eikenella glucosivorans]MBH5329850.1 hypothetical protein [Eikenella glucosivorans]